MWDDFGLKYWCFACVMEYGDVRIPSMGIWEEGFMLGYEYYTCFDLNLDRFPIL